MSTKRTYRGNPRKKARKQGFRNRMSTYEGKKVLKRRMQRKRAKLIP